MHKHADPILVIMTELKPGFYPDPDRENFIRHWNGTSWDELLNDGQSATPEKVESIPLEEIPLEEHYEKFEGSDLQVFLTTNEKTRGPWGLMVKIYDWLLLYVGQAVRQTGDIPEGESNGDVRFGSNMRYRGRIDRTTHGHVLGRKGTLTAMTFFTLAFILLGVTVPDLTFLLFGITFAFITVLVFLKKIKIGREK